MLDPKAAEVCELVAERERAGRLKANKIIRAMKLDWARLKKTYAKG